MISRETARLRKVFERLLVLSAATSGALGAYACSSSSSPAQGFGGKDAATGSDATSGGDSGNGGNNDAAGGGDGAMATGDTGSGGGDAGCSDQPDALFSCACQPGAPTEWDAGADVSPTCVYHIELPCGLPSWVSAVYPPSCNLTLHDCSQICTGAAYPFVKCEVANGMGCDDDAMAFVAADGEAITISCDKCMGVGRRPAGLATPRRRGARTLLGRYLASAAHLEAASVHAFERLAAELESFNAPSALVRAARRSACDEVRHARVTSRLARRFGGEPAPVRVRSRRARTLAAIALENAVEGCVRETYGALVATHQARHAEDQGIRRAMSRIARDETRHAALSWAVARAIEPMLGERARARTAAARARAVEQLRREARAAVPEELVRAAGLPDPCSAARLLDGLVASLWTA